MRDERYERLVRRHRDAVYRQMVRTCGNYDDAEDVLVEALLKAHRAMASLQEEDAFRAWLTSIARRVCFRLRRRDALLPIFSLSGLGPRDLEVAAEGAAEADLGMHEIKKCIHDALSALSPKLRIVYERRELEGEPAERVATELSITVGAVKTRLHRARTIVRARLDRGMCGALWSGQE